MMKEFAKVAANPILSEADKANITAKYFQILIDALLPTIPADAR